MNNTPKKIIVWSWSRDPSLKPVEALIDEGAVEVVLWVSMLGDKDFRSKPFSYVPEKMLKRLALLDRRQDVFYRQSNEQLNRDLNRWMDIYSRVNFSKGLDYHEHVNLFHLYYQYFTNLIKSRGVDAVVFFGAPHVGADYVLYLAAKGLGVDVFVTLQSHVANRFYCVTELDDIGTFETCKQLGEPITLTIPRQHEKKHFYSAFIRNKRKFRLHKLLEDSLRAIFPSRQPISWAGVLQNASSRLNYVKYYKKMAQHEVDFDRKFVYFPLHMQPELSTTILGNEYSDQLLAIEKVSAMIPEDWHIYVKENPTQGAPQRNRLFYERLGRIPNTRYLSERVNTYDLMKSAQFVASISGTACWEAISGGKPALVFGRVWYMNLPGISRYREGMTAQDVLNNRFEHEELERAYSELMSRTIPGIIGLSYAVLYPEFTEENNADLLLAFLRKVLALDGANS